MLSYMTVATAVSALCLIVGSLYLHVPITFATVAVSATSALIVALLCSVDCDSNERGVACVRFTVRVYDADTEQLLHHVAARIGIGLEALSHHRYGGRCTARRFVELRDALGVRAEFGDMVEFAF